MASKAPSHRMQGLLGEFKKLYEGRLAKLKNKLNTGNESTESEWKASLQNYEVLTFAKFVLPRSPITPWFCIYHITKELVI